MNPVQNIQSDRNQARRLKDSNADVCFLALADANGKASVRTLVLRDINDNRFTLFINKTSPKWQAFTDGTGHELLIWYASVQRQYRISGSIQELEAGIVKSNWLRRPTGSKYLDYVYEELGNQSSIIDSRDILTDKINQLKKDLDAQSMQSPPMVAGIELIADRIDVLDLNNQDRIHDRRLYTYDGGTWTSRVLIP
ncbi:MAG: pyridoxamine 5'-phosphate oxidase family protein [Gammaproteobacteria bacterium]|nr:pyridoxamine 5'-phosphate oxidase family protein [Gammaproteobacteria bacterium]